MVGKSGITNVDVTNIGKPYVKTKSSVCPHIWVGQTIDRELKYKNPQDLRKL